MEKEMLEKRGLVKLVEECGELVQIAAKKMTRMDSDEHWDGCGSLNRRLAEETADVQAAIQIIIAEFNLDRQFINHRVEQKYKLFCDWMERENVEPAPELEEQ